MIAERDLTRRSFLKVVGGAGACLTLGSFSSIACASTTAEAKGTDDGAKAFVPNGFVRIEPDGTVTVTICQSDMGQGVRTSLAMLVAEELDADWQKVKVVQAPGAETDAKGRGTGGSSSIRANNQPMRRIGAAARAMLVSAAAQQWGVDASTCTTENGKVLHAASGKSISYGDLTSAASGMPAPADSSVKLKEPSQFKIIGKPTNRVDNPDVVTGRAKYGLDVKVEGMAYAVMARPPVYGATIKGLDNSAAKAVPGVIDTYQLGNEFVAVVAKNTWAAIKGREALKIDWDLGPYVKYNSAQLSTDMKSKLKEHMPMPKGAKVIEAEYEQPFLAHATMEPLNAVADVKPDSCTVWTGTQTPDDAQGQVADLLKLPPSKVTVNVMLLGGGFGRRLENDYVMQAVLVSRAAKMPVKLMWTREDDMRNDFYRPATFHSLKGAIGADGKPLVFSYQKVEASDSADGAKFDPAGLLYDIPTSGTRRLGCDCPVRTGAWRSVDNTYRNFVHECFLDEMLHAGGLDPYVARKELVKDDRLRACLLAAAEKAGWGTPLPKGSGRGIAAFKGYGSYAAHVVEATVKDGKIKVDRVVCAVDPGLAINPRGVEAQIQGGCSDGLSVALRAAITVSDGMVSQGSWDEYEWMTLDAMPPVEVAILQGADSPGGMGEVGFPSVAPALANAIFAATGKRVRKLPIKVEELVG